MLDRPLAWWRARSTGERVHTVLLVALMLAAVIHQAVFWNWYIEDAAISFAYARNLADGYGLVPTPGGERVEGYSNPLWVFLLAVFELVGLESFGVSRVLQLILAAVTVPMVYLLTREAVGDEEHSPAPLLAAGFLAMSSQFAIWGGSGLENALFNALMAAALLRMMVELRLGRMGESPTPWSAVAWLGLALTRPEALAYAAIGGFFSMVFTLADGRGLRPTMTWLGLFWVPFGAYHAIRFDYFAWEFPQTYYAKVGDHKEPKLLLWNGQGWNYLKGWARGMGQGWLFPVYVLGLSGPRGDRAMAGLTLAFVWAATALVQSDPRVLFHVVMGFLFLVYLGLIHDQGDRRPMLFSAGVALTLAFVLAAEWTWAGKGVAAITTPPVLDFAPPILGMAAGLLLPWLAWGAEGARVRGICWTVFAAGLFYAVAVNGDWMKAWRWMNLVAVPGSVLLGLGAQAIGRMAARQVPDSPPLRALTRGHLAELAMVVVLLAWLPANVIVSWKFVERPETGPFSVRERVHYKNRVLDTLHYDGPVVDLDVDMGAHLWWSDHHMLDIAGLVDIPFAQHRFDRGFVHEYVFEEERPHFAHVHGGWAGNSRIPTHPEWRKEYVELPGYPANATAMHPGNFLRRDLVLTTDWPHTADREVMFDRRIELVGWELRATEAAAGRKFALDLGLRLHRRITQGFRVLAFLVDAAGERVVSWDLAPGYDWVEVKDWRRDEVFVGHFSPQLPDDLPEGVYDLGFALVDDGGRVIEAAPNWSPGVTRHVELAPEAVLGGRGPWPARLLEGEVRFPRALTVVSEPALLAASESDRAAALDAADEGRCEAAAEAWADARAHRPKDTEWIGRLGPGVKRAIARCHLDRAADDPEGAVGHLGTARAWDFETPGLDAAAAPVADRRTAEAMAHWEAGELDAAYAAFRDVLRVAPHRSWARRHAETLRSERLGIAAHTKKERPDQWLRRHREQERDGRAVREGAE